MLVGAVLSQSVGVTAKIATTPIEARRKLWQEKIERRLGRTRTAAEAAAGGRALQVSDRVAYRALTEAAVTDDELVADYLGGVIAASGPDDDRGTPVVSLISRLSSEQLRLHYLLYRGLRVGLRSEEVTEMLNRQQYAGPDQASSFFYPDQKEAWLAEFAAGPTLAEALGCGPAGDPEDRGRAREIAARIDSMIAVLRKEALVGPESRVSTKSRHSNGWQPDESYLRVYLQPLVLGAELYLWGHGIRPPETGSHADLLLHDERVELLETPALDIDFERLVRLQSAADEAKDAVMEEIDRAARMHGF